MSEDQSQMITTMKEILQDDYMTLTVRQYTVTEDLERGTCKLSCELLQSDEKVVVEGDGVGMIDALFNALRTTLAEQYPSLNTIEFSAFEIKGLMDGVEDHISSKAEAEATVGILNSEEREFIFKATAPSVSHAGIMATAQAAEYFVNSEKTFVRLNEILEHYRSENRAELVQKYTTLMSEVVKNTSYSEVVERIRNQM